MKVSILFSILISLQGSLLFSRDLTSRVKHVTIFAEDAQLTRSKYVELKKGENILRFTGLELDIQSHTIQISGSSGNQDISIISTEFLKEKIIKTSIEKAITNVKDSIKDLTDDITLLNYQIKNLKEEKAIILAHAKVEYHKEIDYINLLDNLIKYYRKSTFEVDKLMLNLEQKKAIKVSDKTKVESRLRHLSRENKMGIISTKIYAENATNQTLKLTYMVSGVSWTPFYDIKSSGTNKPLEVSSKATIQQNTGIDWKNVDLTLSTKKPIALGTIPSIHPWILHFRRSYKTYSKTNQIIDQRAISNTHIPLNNSINLPKEGLQLQANTFKNATNHMVNRVFKSRLKYNISGKNGSAVMELNRFDMESKYKYYAIPKYDQNVYLVANIHRHDQYDLIPAFANIFLEGLYMGKLFINPEVIHSSLELMLGKDSEIIVDRRKVKQDQEKQFRITGNTRTTSIEIELLVKNRKKSDIEMVIKDQLPVSREKDILVTPLKISKAELDSTSGTLTWKNKIPSLKSTKYIIKYEVQHPKNKPIANF